MIGQGGQVDFAKGNGARFPVDRTDHFLLSHDVAAIILAVHERYREPVDHRRRPVCPVTKRLQPGKRRVQVTGILCRAPRPAKVVGLVVLLEKPAW